MKGRFRQGGFLLIAAIVLLIVLSFFALVITDLYVGNTRSGTYHLASGQALFLSEAGLQRAAHGLLSPTVMTPGSTDNRQSCSSINTNLTNVALGTGAFSVTGGNAFYSGDTTNPAMTVSGALSATATLIPLANTASLADYAPAGRAMIDREEVNYSAISQNATVCGTSACLTGVTRGVDGTQAVAHASGTPVGQYQCPVQSQGGVPSLANARGKRVLGEGIQLQEGWAVGSEGSYALNTPVTTLLRWGGNGWIDASGAIASNTLNAITCTSYADCWAVGSANLLGAFGFVPRPPPVATALHWDGHVWTDLSATLPGGPGGVAKDDLDGVTCVSYGDCWMVGAFTKKQWAVAHVSWSGAGAPVWQTYPPPRGVPKKGDVDSIACVSTTLCWGVGSVSQQRLLLVEWNGTSWSDARAQLPPNGAIRSNNMDLEAITCSTGACWAVGSAGFASAAIAYWSAATGWQDLTGQVAGSMDVEGVTCAAPNSCWAVGSWNLASTLLYWNGVTWTDQSSTIPASISGNFFDLDGISCRGLNDCWAVGSILGPILTGRPEITAMHWDGTSWTDFSGAMPNGNDVEGIVLVSPGAHPHAAWQEVFP